MDHNDFDTPKAFVNTEQVAGPKKARKDKVYAAVLLGQLLSLLLALSGTFSSLLVKKV